MLSVLTVLRNWQYVLYLFYCTVLITQNNMLKSTISISYHVEYDKNILPNSVQCCDFTF